VKRLAAALCFVLLAACHSTATVSGTFPPSTPPPTPTPSPTPAPTPIIVHGTKLFHTPSGNIGCVISNQGSPLMARCDIGVRSWKAPKKPKDCPLDYGNGVSVTDGKKAVYTCAGDTVLHQGDEVAYGQKLRLGVLECDVATIGVTCTNDASQHGFFLSKATVRLF
jgi:uncharacterized protein DUF6636